MPFATALTPPNPPLRKKGKRPNATDLPPLAKGSKQLSPLAKGDKQLSPTCKGGGSGGGAFECLCVVPDTASTRFTIRSDGTVMTTLQVAGHKQLLQAGKEMIRPCTSSV